MSGKDSWMWVSLGLICLLIVMAYFAVYYYSESVRYQSLYKEALNDLKRLTMPVSILIDYGNGTRFWHNNTLVPRGANLLLATEIAAEVESETYPEMGEFVTSINGVGGELGKYWIWYTWNPEKSDWEWGPVACDRYILREGEVVMWRYEQF